MRLSLAILLTLLIWLAHQPFAQAQAAAQIRTEIALKISPFIEIKDKNLIYCIQNKKINLEFEDFIKKIAAEIKPPIQLRINPETNLSKCNFFLIDTDLPSEILLATQTLKNQTLIISFGKNSLQYGADIAITRSGNKHEIQLNIESIKKKGGTPHPQLLNISKDSR